MKDVDGVELAVGQRVAVATNNRNSVDFRIGAVVGFTRKNVRVILKGRDAGMLKAPYLLAVLMNQGVTRELSHLTK